MMHLNVDLIGYLLTCWWSSIPLWGEKQCSTQSSGPCCTILCTHRDCSQMALCQVLRCACLLPFITSLSVFSLLALSCPQSSAIISSLWKKTFPWVTRCGKVSWYILDRTEYASNMALIIIISTVMYHHKYCDVKCDLHKKWNSFRGETRARSFIFSVPRMVPGKQLSLNTCCWLVLYHLPLLEASWVVRW